MTLGFFLKTLYSHRMIEFNDDIPFLWRLSSQDDDDFCVVSMVVPFTSGVESHEHTIETDILSFACDVGDETEELEWNEEDLSLFLKLIASRRGTGAMTRGETIRVDLADPETIEIIQIVAAAGFGLALPADAILAHTNRTLIATDFEIGSPVSIHTIEGYKRCVVVDMDDDDVVCVMLDKVESPSAGQHDDIHPYDLLLLKRHHILPPEYAGAAPPRSGVLH